jgi:hypothetical protein
VIDADGQVLGTLISETILNPQPQSLRYDIFVPQLQRLLAIETINSGTQKLVVFTQNNTNIEFAGPNCTGQAFVATESGPLDEIHLHFSKNADATEGRFFLAGAALAADTPAAQSYISSAGGSCINSPPGAFHDFTYLATEVTLPFDLPLIGPLRIRPQ